jgi:RHS repeat-associated protein
MKQEINITLSSTSPPTQPTRKPRSFASLDHRQRYIYGRIRRYNTGKELDNETGLYYYGARYMDPKISRWLSGDPALGEYVPSAPVSGEARKRDGSLPGMGGVFNCVNLHVYHYAGNNPVKYTDPDGKFLGIKSQMNRDAERRSYYYSPKHLEAWVGKGYDVSIIEVLITDAERNDLTSDIFHNAAVNIARDFGFNHDRAVEYALQEKQRYEKILEMGGIHEPSVKNMLNAAERKYNDVFSITREFNSERGRVRDLSLGERKQRADIEANKIIDAFIEQHMTME